MKYVTVKQAATMLQCSKDRVISRIKRGVLVACKELDPKAGAYSFNERWLIELNSVEVAKVAKAAAEAAKD